MKFWYTTILRNCLNYRIMFSKKKQAQRFEVWWVLIQRLRIPKTVELFSSREWVLCMGPAPPQVKRVARYTCTSPPVVAGVSLHNNEPRDTVQRNTRDTVCNALTW